MTVLRESPWYQEILSEGKTLGLERGLEQGLEQSEKS
jgi:predicted transposase YdaD